MDPIDQSGSDGDGSVVGAMEIRALKQELQEDLEGSTDSGSPVTTPSSPAAELASTSSGARTPAVPDEKPKRLLTKSIQKTPQTISVQRLATIGPSARAAPKDDVPVGDYMTRLILAG